MYSVPTVSGALLGEGAAGTAAPRTELGPGSGEELSFCQGFPKVELAPC